MDYNKEFDPKMSEEDRNKKYKEWEKAVLRAREWVEE